MPEPAEKPTPTATDPEPTPPVDALPVAAPAAGEQPTADASVAAEAAAAAGEAAPAASVEPAAPAAAELSPAACAALLAERFPALFGAGRALPIKLRIQADIQARAPGVFTKKSLSIFLHRHTTTTAYLRSLVSQPHRFDLDGQPAGEVAEEHRAAAAAEVERRRGIVEARRQAERDAQRQAHAATRDAERRAQAQARAAAQAAAAARAAADAPARLAEPVATPATRPPEVAADMPASVAIRPAQAALGPAELEARRERAALLRAWESSTLTRANFCVLKRIAEAELEAQLVQARREHEQHVPQPRPPARADESRRAGAHRPGEPGPQRDDRGPRPARGAPHGKPPAKPSR